MAANRDKISVIAKAQQDGRVTDRFPAHELMVLVSGLSILGSPDLAMTHSDDIAERRRTVVEAVTLLVKGEGS